MRDTLPHRADSNSSSHESKSENSIPESNRDEHSSSKNESENMNISSSTLTGCLRNSTNYKPDPPPNNTDFNVARMSIDQEPSIRKSKVYKFNNKSNHLHKDKKGKFPAKIARWSNKEDVQLLYDDRIAEDYHGAKDRTSAGLSIRTGSLITMKTDTPSPKL
jgi:hypothetical protein